MLMIIAIIFCFVESSFLFVKCLQVFLNKKPVSMSDLRPGISVINVLHNIAVLQPLLLCDGTGFNER